MYAGIRVYLCRPRAQKVCCTCSVPVTYFSSRTRFTISIYNENKTTSNGIRRWCLQTRRHRRRRRLYSSSSSDSRQPTTRRSHYHFFFDVYLFIYASTTAASGAHNILYTSFPMRTVVKIWLRSDRDVDDDDRGFHRIPTVNVLFLGGPGSLTPTPRVH